MLLLPCVCVPTYTYLPTYLRVAIRMRTYKHTYYYVYQYECIVLYCNILLNNNNNK
jgi:hypothetical protein